SADQADLRRGSARRRRSLRRVLRPRGTLPAMVRGAVRRAALIAAAAALLSPGAADADAYLRVIGQTAPVHSGPAAGYREVYVADRGEVFRVLERAGDGFWFRIELEDGTTGWVL